jgi:hypothetical protein
MKDKKENKAHVINTPVMHVNIPQQHRTLLTAAKFVDPPM